METQENNVIGGEVRLKRGIPAIKDKSNPKYDELNKYTNINKAQKKSTKIFKEAGTLYISEKKNKKFKIYDTIYNKWVHFGAMGYEDFNKHNDKERQYNYLRRATNIKGDWKENPFSRNNLSIYINWL